MDPHRQTATSPRSMVSGLLRHRQLILQMARREVEYRYKGSIFGLAWSFITPITLLFIYTFVFSIVFKARWGAQEVSGDADFALVLFIGLILHALISDIINRAPTLIVSNSNYVTKVVFPLEIIPVTTTLTALFHAVVSICVLLIAFFFVNGFINWTVIFIIPILMPFLMMALGFAWFLSALGVFLRDIGQAVGILTTVMLFMAPVFYPISAVPEQFHTFILANPLTFIVNQAREVIIFGAMPNLSGFGVYTIISLLISFSGYYFFQYTRKGFADVI